LTVTALGRHRSGQRASAPIPGGRCRRPGRWLRGSTVCV